MCFLEVIVIFFQIETNLNFKHFTNVCDFTETMHFLQIVVILLVVASDLANAIPDSNQYKHRDIGHAERDLDQHCDHYCSRYTRNRDLIAHCNRYCTDGIITFNRESDHGEFTEQNENKNGRHETNSSKNNDAGYKDDYNIDQTVEDFNIEQSVDDTNTKDILNDRRSAKKKAPPYRVVRLD